jgi:glycosidase
VARIATSLKAENTGVTDSADLHVRAKLKLAVLLQFTHPGVPLVYYGDELAMEGDQNHCRLGMRWDRVEQEADLLDWYRRFARLRRTQPVLAGGDWRVVQASAETGLYIFARTPAEWWNMGGEAGSLLIVANCSDRPQTWKLPAALASAPVWRDFTARGGLLAGLRTRVALETSGLQLAPWTGTVLKPCIRD